MRYAFHCRGADESESRVAGPSVTAFTRSECREGRRSQPVGQRGTHGAGTWSTPTASAVAPKPAGSTVAAPSDRSAIDRGGHLRWRLVLNTGRGCMGESRGAGHRSDTGNSSMRATAWSRSTARARRAGSAKYASSEVWFGKRRRWTSCGRPSDPLLRARRTTSPPWVGTRASTLSSEGRKTGRRAFVRPEGTAELDLDVVGHTLIRGSALQPLPTSSDFFAVRPH